MTVSFFMQREVIPSDDEAQALPVLLGLMFMPQMLQQQIVGSVAKLPL